jgi:uncharacterized protein
MDTLSLSAPELGYCALVLVLAYGLRGSTGFGGVVGMPLLALVVPMKVLVPVWTLLGIASSATIVGQGRRHVAYRDLLPFLPWCLLGIVVGLYFFAALDGRTLARGLGVLVTLYALHALWSSLRTERPRRTRPRLVAPLASALSGVVGALFGAMATLFFVMYLDTRELARHAFRATISAMLLVLSVVRGVGYYLVGEFTWEVLVVFAAALPAMGLGIYLGSRLHMRIDELTFRRVVVSILLVTGASLLLRPD